MEDLTQQNNSNAGQAQDAAGTPPPPATGETPARDPLSGLTMGRVVHYVIATREHRAAIVVRVDETGSDDPIVRGTINLRVFLDDGDVGRELSERRNNAPFDSADFPEGHTWHWPERT